MPGNRLAGPQILETDLLLSVASLGPSVHISVEQRGEVFP
ncbi:hypothetical protein BOO71_0014524 [Deinococcus marmoris]|uniref:Uncharacterized protein n=1 Tax=Deinococcus marmoris TaxID=249408 RepID=A0A1U7NRL5_9DEIO|nr:hypothetical protein BOO71_0014524 [Deinococcus marmoris]